MINSMVHQHRRHDRGGGGAGGGGGRGRYGADAMHGVAAAKRIQQRRMGQDRARTADDTALEMEQGAPASPGTSGTDLRDLYATESKGTPMLHDEHGSVGAASPGGGGGGGGGDSGHLPGSMGPTAEPSAGTPLAHNAFSFSRVNRLQPLPNAPLPSPQPAATPQGRSRVANVARMFGTAAKTAPHTAGPGDGAGTPGDLETIDGEVPTLMGKRRPSGQFVGVASAVNKFAHTLRFKRFEDQHTKQLQKLHAVQSYRNLPPEIVTQAPQCCFTCSRCCSRLRPYVIPLDSTFTRIWDVWFIFAVFWVVVRVPFNVAFGDDRGSAVLRWCDVVMKLSFIIDLVLRFFSEVMYKGYTVGDPSTLAWRYVTGWFWIDVVSSFPYDFVAGRGSLWSLLMLLRLFSLAKVEKVEKRITAALEMSPTSRLLLRLCKLFAYMMFIAHITACVWFLIADREDDPENSWVYLYGIDQEPWEVTLLSSYYWSLTTLTTVGYGDISAHTNIERAWSLLMLCVGAAMFAVLVGKMSALSTALNEEESESTRRRDEVNYYLKQHNVPAHIRQRTRAYYDYINHAQTFLNEEHMLDDLSPPLRREVGVHLNRRLLDQVPVLRSADPAFQASIVSLLRPTVVLAGEYIICAGDVGYEMYILRQGNVAVLDSDGHDLYQLTDGSFFGEDQLLYRVRATHSFRARYNCEMYRLHRMAFRNLIEDFPDFEATLRKAATERKAVHVNAEKLQQHKQDQRRKSAERRPETPPMGFPDWASVKKVVATVAEFPASNQLARNRVMAAMEYVPNPLNFNHLRIPRYLDPLTEAMAINMHETWAASRREQGWSWGKSRDDDSKKHPDLMPYECMPDSSLAFDRRLSLSIVRHVLGRGYSFSCEGSVAQLEGWLMQVRANAQQFRDTEDPTFTYTPFPFPCDTIDLPPALLDIVEDISKNIHEVWAEERIKSGWSWGPARDNSMRRHPSLLPYEMLSSDEQSMNRSPVLTTMKMVIAMGFGLVLGTAPKEFRASKQNTMKQMVMSLVSSARKQTLEHLAAQDAQSRTIMDPTGFAADMGDASTDSARTDVDDAAGAGGSGAGAVPPLAPAPLFARPPSGGVPSGRRSSNSGGRRASGGSVYSAGAASARSSGPSGALSMLTSAKAGTPMDNAPVE